MELLSDVWPAVTFLVLYTGLLFGGFHWMLKSIKDLLTNHITETNKKIDRLSDHFDRLSARIERQSERLGARIERQSERFDRLYEILLKEKEQK